MNHPHDLDRETFQRVWRRVMPQDRPDVPVALAPPHGGPAPPPALPRPPRPPAPSPRPPLPPQPGPQRPPVCLGEASRGEIPALERLTAQAAEDRRIYRALERRWSGEKLFRELAAAKEGQLRALTAARFLIDGQRKPPAASPPPKLPGALSQALRQRHRAEQEAAAAFLQAGAAARDPCLAGLYRDAGRADQGYAGRIRARLEGRR